MSCRSSNSDKIVCSNFAISASAIYNEIYASKHNDRVTMCARHKAKREGKIREKARKKASKARQRLQ
jgi:hypothetical protein